MKIEMLGIAHLVIIHDDGEREEICGQGDYVSTLVVETKQGDYLHVHVTGHEGENEWEVEEEFNSEEEQSAAEVQVRDLPWPEAYNMMQVRQWVDPSYDGENPAQEQYSTDRNDRRK